MLWTTIIVIQTDYTFTLLFSVDEMIEGDCSHCRRSHVVPVDPDSCQSVKI